MLFVPKGKVVLLCSRDNLHVMILLIDKNQNGTDRRGLKMSPRGLRCRNGRRVF